jgi:hypothetical protein
VWAIPSCSRTTEAVPQTSVAESWNADLTATGHVLFLSLRRQDSTVTGTGSLRSLLSPGAADALVVAGQYRSDSLILTLNAVAGYQMHFTGTYGVRHASLSGTLDGGAFSNQRVSFRTP